MRARVRDSVPRPGMEEPKSMCVCVCALEASGGAEA